MKKKRNGMKDFNPMNEKCQKPTLPYKRILAKERGYHKFRYFKAPTFTEREFTKDFSSGKLW
jgi:hypothetical protein